MKDAIVRLTPLRLTVDVQCARRGWSFRQFTNAVQAALPDEVVSYNALVLRIEQRQPTKATIELCAIGFGISVEDLLVSMVRETRKALQDGLRVVGDLCIHVPVDSAVLAPTAELTYGTPEFVQAVEETKAALAAQQEGDTDESK